jgi:8-oxo-dGTP diphosphatase
MYKNPTPTVDIVILKGREVVLIQRGHDPFKGSLAFPGGFVDEGETLEDAAKREAKEETGLDVEIRALLGVYSAPDRDPRKHTVSSVFIAHPIRGELEGGDDASDAVWMDLDTITPSALAFDHGLILTDLLRWTEDQSQTFWSSKPRE